LISERVEDGYDKRTDTVTTADSSTFMGEDKNGSRVSFRFRLRCTPGKGTKTMTVTILQDMVEVPES